MTPPHQRTPTNCIRLISPDTTDRGHRGTATVGYIFAADSIYASPSILKQSGLKIGASLINEGALNLQDRKMTDKSAAGKNVKHIVLTFKNHQTKLINVHDLEFL